MPVQRTCSKAVDGLWGNVYCTTVQPGIQMSKGVRGDGTASEATPGL